LRTDGRLPEETRPLKLTRDFTRYAQGSVLVEAGETRVICTAMAESRVPRHCMSANMGWVSAEYTMLPGANPDRRSLHGRPNGRTLEISRLIGRSLRAAVDLTQMPGITIWVDCSVVQADGGTRTASITGGFVALADAIARLRKDKKIKGDPLVQGLAAVSVGIVEGRLLVDLCSSEDKAAAVDMNVVMTHDGGFVELQGTAEGRAFTRQEHDKLIGMAAEAIEQIRGVQMAAISERLKSD